MSRYTYSMGNWTQGSSVPDWNDNESFEDYLQRIGYSSFKRLIGNEYGASIEIFTSSEGNKFLANVSPVGSNLYEVFIQDFPSLMLFLKDFASVFSLIAIQECQAETREMIEKLFNVYHRHSAHDICKNCSPSEWNSQHDRKQDT